MMLRLIVILSCMALTNAVVFAQDSEEVVSDWKVQQVERSQIKRYQDILDKVDALLKKSEDALGNNKFETARKYCSQSDALLKKQEIFGPYVGIVEKRVKALRTRIASRWSEHVFTQARKAYLNNDYDQAILLARKAADINPSVESDVEGFIKECEESIDSEKYAEKTALLAIDPDNAVRKEDLYLLIKKAEVLCANKQYMKARDALERVLIGDPYNKKAMDMLDKIYRKLNEVAKFRRRNDIKERIAEVEWKWSEAVLPTEDIKPEIAGAKKSQTSPSGLYEKLQTIIFDTVNFDNASISSVITHLNLRSKQLDPNTPKTGVNIILNLRPEEKQAVPRITMSFDQIPMAEVIRYLCQGANLKYRIEPHAVIIGNENIDEMETRFFNVRAALVASISGGGMAEGGGGGDEDIIGTGEFDVEIGTMDVEEGKAAATSDATSAALQAYFEDRGVPFPTGSTIAYDRRSGKLVVKNLPENLRRLESLLRDLDITTPLVLIEAKIVEINQDDLEELGFDWVFSSTGHSTADGREFPERYPNTWVVAPTEKLVRSYAGGGNVNSTDPTARAAEVIKDMVIVPNFGDDNQKNLLFSLYAIDRSGKGEVLSAPKVIATSGTMAIIRMVREEYFPESWTEPEISVSETQSTYTPSYPEFGDATDVGIRFEVTPTVSPNNYTISLSLNPQIIALTGWTQYPYSIVVRDVSSEVLIKMPELSRRDLNAHVKVYDGETVVLGGMLREETSERQDKYPLLGDVPILGRFFTSTMDNSTKRNLLIFVTARLVSGDGVPVRENALRGVPDFQR